MAVKTDYWIRRMAKEAGLIEPFSERVAGPDVVSYGLQPCGYDVRLDPQLLAYDWAKAQGVPIDPLAPPDPAFYSEKLAIPYFDIPPRGSVQGMSLEYLRIPPNITVLGRGKATYSSISVNVSSINPGWEGRLRIHIANANATPVRIYGEQGILYLEFSETDGPCETPYDRLPGTRFQGQRFPLIAPSRPTA